MRNKQRDRDPEGQTAEEEEPPKRLRMTCQRSRGKPRQCGGVENRRMFRGGRVIDSTKYCKEVKYCDQKLLKKECHLFKKSFFFYVCFFFLMRILNQMRMFD